MNPLRACQGPTTGLGQASGCCHVRPANGKNKQMTTKFSPFFLLFGREARYPCEIPEEYGTAQWSLTSSRTPKRKMTSVSPLRCKAMCLPHDLSPPPLSCQALPLPHTLSPPRSIPPSPVGSSALASPRSIPPSLVGSPALSPPRSIPSSPVGFPALSPHRSIPPSPVGSPVLSPPRSIPPCPVGSPSLSPPNSLPPSPLCSTALSTNRGHPHSPLTSAGEAVQASATDTVIETLYVLPSKIGPFKVYFEDIHRTAPNMEVESEVMNAYMPLLVKSFNKESKGRAIAIDTFEMCSIWQQKQAKVKLDPQDYKYILGIINACNHWTLMCATLGLRGSMEKSKDNL
ncbi:hypothetical protein G5714_019825 [Onychostoma macrolepis]|uniref:Uncharacterized protein n=1 Tax=Onychostoma macrolepis TaxID=369639 RepID=A0A7J6BXH5_9TELE|nr:hypothetical protein G5714_019825 [Onychostoma macrolepis]